MFEFNFLLGLEGQIRPLVLHPERERNKDTQYYYTGNTSSRLRLRQHKFTTLEGRTSAGCTSFAQHLHVVTI